MKELDGPLGAVDRARLFDAFEHAATRVGLAVFVVHVDASPPLVIYASEAIAELVGKPLHELVGKPPWHLVAPAHRDAVRDTIASRGPGAPPLTTQTEIERPDGTRRRVEVGVARITTTTAELAVCYFRDTTPLRKSEARFRALVEKAPDGIVILQDGRIVLANPVAVRMFDATNFDAVRGRLLSDFLVPEDTARAFERIAKLHQGVQFESSEYRLRHGLVVEVHSTLFEYNDKPAILAFVRDATDRRRMQERLFHADRLAALGTMAATVAHEINNPLTYLHLSLQQIERDPTRLREHLANAMNGLERVARIVRDLRVYSHPTSDESHGPVDVIAVVESALQLVAHDLRHRAQLVRRYTTEPAIVDGSASRLEQVVVNLLVNAIQSLDGSNNEITLAIDVTDDDVTLSVSDTGRGIAHPERIFDPFFTTKGDGTGLGLSVCKQIVERMRGRIELRPSAARGTTFAVTLPRRCAIVRELTPPPSLPTPPRRRILVVDDEPLVRDSLKNLLSTEHDIETAGDGESALELLGNTDFDVILCDVMMPRMDGRDIYERIRARWPGRERRIVFVTGGAFVPSLATFLDSVDNVKLRKPFTVERVLELLDVTTS